MNAVYEEMISFIVSSGKRIAPKAGKIKDIGVKKKYLTEEDIAIERGMKKIIHHHHPAHAFYAEEEHDQHPEGTDVWIADPISGTRSFLAGLPHYALVIAHARNSIVQFSAVYDPSADELFTAYRGKGAFLNKKKLFLLPKKGILHIVFNLSINWADAQSAQEVAEKMRNFSVSTNSNSHAVNICHVACNRYDGAICLAKDSFPYFAASLILTEAGGLFTNQYGDPIIHYHDRVFLGGKPSTYQQLKKIMEHVKLPENSR
ncbi:MAG: inositol monophosphatase family protein [Nanoarchaeota archaeon]